MVVSLLLFDRVAAVTCPTLLAAFDLDRETSSAGPADALLAFVLCFLAHHPWDFLLSTEKKSAKPSCTV